MERNKTHETVLTEPTGEKSVREQLRELERELSDPSLPLWKKILRTSWVGEQVIGREVEDFDYYENELFKIRDKLKKNRKWKKS